jgi:hypothetical protein
MKMIEKMARALSAQEYAEAYGLPLDDPHVLGCVDGNWITSIPAAKAALTTLLDPDEGMADAMIVAGDELHDGCGPLVESANDLHAKLFTAAIQHALSESD